MSAADGRAPPVRWARRDLLVALAGLALLVAWDAAGLDLPSMRLIGGADGFPWQHHWLTERVLHSGSRALGWALLALLFIGIWRPLPPLSAVALPRAERVRWVLATLACAAVVPLLKQASRTSCPWDLQLFGGVAQYVSHWRWGVSDGGSGRCFPSGHASVAFSFLSGWFAWRVRAPARARLWLAGVLVAGVVLGAGQWLRGAHYPSHTMWTAWVCWCVCALVFRVPLPRAGNPAV